MVSASRAASPVAFGIHDSQRHFGRGIQADAAAVPLPGTQDDEISIDFELDAEQRDDRSTAPPPGEVSPPLISDETRGIRKGEDDVGMGDAHEDNSSARSTTPRPAPRSPLTTERMSEDELDEKTEEGNFRYGKAKDGARITDKPPKPLFFLKRKSGLVTPLIAVDELPETLQIQGIPRVLPEENAWLWTEGSKIMPKLYPRSQFPYEPNFLNQAPPIDTRSEASVDFDFGDGDYPDPGRHIHAAINAAERTSRGGPRYETLNMPRSQNQTRDQDRENLVPDNNTWTERAGRYTQLLSDQWANQGRTLPGTSNGFGAFPKANNDSGQIYNPVTKGVFGRKIFCSHWLRTGECDFTQQGCNYLHLMPDLDTMETLGMKQYPRWFRELPRQQQQGCAAEFDPSGLESAEQRKAYISPPRYHRHHRDGPRGKNHVDRDTRTSSPNGPGGEAQTRRGRENARQPNYPRPMGGPGQMHGAPMPNPHFLAKHPNPPFNPYAQPQPTVLQAQMNSYPPMPSPSMSASPMLAHSMPGLPMSAPPLPGPPYPPPPRSPHFANMGFAHSPLLSGLRSPSRPSTPQGLMNPLGPPYLRRGSDATVFSITSNPLEHQSSSAPNMQAYPVLNGSSGAGNKRGSDAIHLAGGHDSEPKRVRSNSVVSVLGQTPTTGYNSMSPFPTTPRPMAPVTAEPMNHWGARGVTPARLPPDNRNLAHLLAISSDARNGAEAVTAATATPLPDGEDELDYGEV